MSTKSRNRITVEYNGSLFEAVEDTGAPSLTCPQCALFEECFWNERILCGELASLHHHFKYIRHV